MECKQRKLIGVFLDKPLIDKWGLGQTNLNKWASDT